jgi:hypothetical protein
LWESDTRALSDSSSDTSRLPILQGTKPRDIRYFSVYCFYIGTNRDFIAIIHYCPSFQSLFFVLLRKHNRLKTSKVTNCWKYEYDVSNRGASCGVSL